MGGDRTVALISGANRGIGREIARQLAAAGHLVLVGSREVAAGEQAAAEIGAGAEAIQLDVADANSIAAAAERISSHPGRLDVLVNNAGVYGQPVGVADYDPGSARALFEVNLFGAWNLTQAVLPLLRRSGHGRVVNVSSGAGQLTSEGEPLRPRQGRGAYRISKAGLNMLTVALAADEAENGVLVNSLCPGWVRTDMGGPGATRSVEEGAETAVWLATSPDDGPSGGFFRDRSPIPW